MFSTILVVGALELLSLLWYQFYVEPEFYYRAEYFFAIMIIALIVIIKNLIKISYKFEQNDCVLAIMFLYLNVINREEGD